MKTDVREKFRAIYDRYERTIELHEISISVIGNYAKKYDYSITKKIIEIIKKIDTKNGKLTALDLSALAENLDKHPQQELLFLKNTIVSIVSLMDNMFSLIFRYYYSKNPDKLSIDNKSITYLELDQVEKIDDAKTYLLDKEIETILLNEGIRNRFKILKEEMGIILPNNQEHLQELDKLIKTRNLIVHNSCNADQEYIKKYSTESLKKGNEIPLDREYVLNSLALAFYVGGFILQSTQIKYTDKKLNSSDFILNDLIHELVKKEKYTYLKEIYNVSQELALDDSTKKMIVINFCIGAKKQKKSKEHIEKILIKEDWSMADDYISLCLYALRDKHELFYSQLKKLIKDKRITGKKILEWQIFTLYRKKAKFREIIKKVIK